MYVFMIACMTSNYSSTFLYCGTYLYTAPHFIAIIQGYIDLSGHASYLKLW